MRLGGAVFVDRNDLEVWATAQVTAGYSAVFPPFGYEADESRIRELQTVCQRHNLLIAEVGAWSNPISPDGATRNKALEHCIKSLDFAERLGARCCVNIAGARGEQWDGPHPDNLTEETFDLIVETTRAIIDSVKPKRTCYSLETMPWVFPDSPESYLRLVNAIDRPGQFGVHLDPVNIINSPQRYFENGKFLRSCFEILAPHIVSCHAKDITLSGKLTVHLDEVPPGKGALDYGVFLVEMAKLDRDTPLMLEHMSTEEEYTEATRFVRGVAKQVGVEIVEPITQ